MIELTILGNVGAARLHQNEKTTVLSVSLASSRKAGEGKIYTDWVTAKIWGERGVTLERHITKGQKLLIRGRPEVSPYTKADGQLAAELLLHARDVEFVGPKPGGTSSDEDKPKPRKRRQVAI